MIELSLSLWNLEAYEDRRLENVVTVTATRKWRSKKWVWLSKVGLLGWLKPLNVYDSLKLDEDGGL
jgi:hypothetical protein